MVRRLALFLMAFLLCLAPFVLVPGLDLAASGLFYRPAEGFFLADRAPLRAVHEGLRYLVWAVVAAEAILLVLALRGRPWRGVSAAGAAFLLLALALGPGLLVNAVFKDHWGRARPAQITEFGGSRHFSKVFVPSDQCSRNCSFPAGDPAMGFYFVAVGFLATAPRRRRAVVAGAIGVGAFLGIVRIAQGGHFLSDVIASGFLVYGATWLLWRWIVVHDGLRRLRHPPPALQRFAGLSLAIAFIGILSYEVADRPLAQYFAGSSDGVHRGFLFITQFGLSGGYLIGAAVLALLCMLAAPRLRDPALARRLRLNAWRAIFVFSAIAVPGLVADVLKPVFGRARPPLFLHDGIYGFFWQGPHASYWSFPSGHTVTAAALATALYLLYRRHLSLLVLFAVLIGLSRVIITEHYLSDVIAGAWLGVGGTLMMWSIFRSSGLYLGPDAAGRS